jgi:predicted AlkP superfamily pyrophosphatase or phosphodiesterase
MITLDTLRYDVAEQALRAGQTPSLAALLPEGRWQRRHSPGSFTYAAHHAFFAGFLPTPATPECTPEGVPIPPSRLFAAAFPGSETTAESTAVFDAPDIVHGLEARGYHTVCIGGVGFFNQLTPLGRVLPGLFRDSHWQPCFGVTDRRSTEHQVTFAIDRMDRLSAEQRLFLFINISAIHQPNHAYLDGAGQDSLATQAAALAYVDSQLPPLFAALRRRADTLCIICSDHGTAYGDDGYHGHRLAHPVVWEVPYAEFLLPRTEDDR